MEQSNLISGTSMMRRLMYLSLIGAFIVVLTTSCVSNQEYNKLRAEYDSISILNLAYQDQAYETDSLVASVIAGFQELNAVESMINVNALRGDLPASEQKRIRKNVKLLADRLEESNSSIELLIKRIESHGSNSMRMQGTITMLRDQLTRQQERITTIVEETINKVNSVNALDANIRRLRDEANRMKAHNIVELERLKLVEDSLNTVYYAMGTKDDLRVMRLINREDRVNVDNAELSYLTQADKRRLSEVNMLSKTARLLSIHPRSSYKMKADAKGYLTLEILDPRSFWTFSQIMLVEVDF